MASVIPVEASRVVAVNEKNPLRLECARRSFQSRAMAARTDRTPPFTTVSLKARSPVALKRAIARPRASADWSKEL